MDYGRIGLIEPAFWFVLLFDMLMSLMFVLKVTICPLLGQIK